MILLSSFTSGNPAMEVATDKIPDKTDDDITNRQSTALITALVPIVAAKVCATVFTARTPAAFHHLFVFSFTKNTLLSTSQI